MQTTKDILANEAKRQQLKNKEAELMGTISAQARVVGLLSTQVNDTQQRLTRVREEIHALEAGAGPGVTDEFGDRSAVDILLRSERFAGKAAAVEHVKANPEATEEEAAAAWRSAGMAATGLPVLMQDPLALGEVYRQRLVAGGRINEATWEAQRAWMVATPSDDIMAL